jgi:hypothetical protein
MPDWAQHLMPRLDVLDQLLSDVCYLHLGSKTQPCSFRLPEENPTLLFKATPLYLSKTFNDLWLLYPAGKGLHQNVANLSSGQSICRTLGGRKSKQNSDRAFATLSRTS